MEKRKSYLGSKGASGVLQNIINNIPEHHTYIEPFVGSGFIVLNKKPAIHNLINDLDTNQAEEVINKLIAEDNGNYIAVSKNALTVMKNAARRRYYQENETFIYCDPPYVHSTRTSNARYKFEMSNEDHCELLEFLKDCKANVMISGYPSQLYNDHLQDWKTVEFQAMTRGGVRTEKLWMNYDISKMRLHQTDMLGVDFTDRQRIKRKIARINKKLDSLPRHEKQAIIDNLLNGTQ